MELEALSRLFEVDESIVDLSATGSPSADTAPSGAGGVPETDSGPASKLDLEGSGARYRAWRQQLRRVQLLPVEHLLPRIRVPCPKRLPALMEHGATRTQPPDGVLRARIQELAPWGYGIQLRPGVVTEQESYVLERTVYRSYLITGAVTRLLGDRLREATVLDLACNHGYYSLEIAFHGAREACGVDLRTANITRARFLADYFGVDGARFQEADVYDLVGDGRRYDVVYNLGLLYHVTDPYRLLDLTYRMCGAFAVVDSIMHKEPVAAYLQMANKDTTQPGEGAYSVELHPTYRAVIDAMHAVGFRDLVEVAGVAPPGGEKATHELYERFDRRCIIGFK